MKLRSTFIFIVGLFVITSLACSQAGEIISPEEATARAQVVPDDTGPGGGTSALGVEVGDSVILTGKGFLVNLLDQPGGRIAGGQARDSEVVITNIATVEGITWYEIDANNTVGWVKEANIIVPEVATTFEGPQINDEVYLAGKSFLVNILGEPNGNIVSGDSRGEAVTVTDIRDADGEIWHMIDSRAGAGWVPAENITEDAP